MTFDDGKLVSKSVYSGNAMVKVGDGTLLLAAHTGNSVLHTYHRPLTIKHILHVHQFQHNLLSVR